MPLLPRVIIIINGEKVEGIVLIVVNNKAEQAKMEAEQAFEDCTDVASQEIKRFHRLRAAALASALERYGEAQLSLARNVYQVLQQSIQTLKSFEL